MSLQTEIAQATALVRSAERAEADAQHNMWLARTALAALLARQDMQRAYAAERAAQGLLTVESDEDLAILLNDDPFVPSTMWQGYEQWTGDGYGIALAFSRPVADPTHLLAYFCRANLAMGWDGFNGESTGTPVDVTDAQGRACVWYWPCDLTKSARDDIAAELGDLAEFMQFGSPLRKTDRSGPGTKGTRAVAGVGADVQVYVALDY